MRLWLIQKDSDGDADGIEIAADALLPFSFLFLFLNIFSPGYLILFGKNKNKKIVSDDNLLENYFY